ncbi:MAG: hypothetical protein LBK56_03320 [Gracilibacteraceae bacterium]|jgi:hypothetical protein|nr:hypothetical protein [Gracilibacteraceae bacterium]
MSARLLLNELKKIGRPRILLLIAVMGALVFFAFMRPYIDSFKANMLKPGFFNAYGDWQNEMFDLYGETLSAAELADFDIPGRKAALEAEIDAMIAAEPLFADYGVHSFAEYREDYYAGYSRRLAEADAAERDKLQADNAAIYDMMFGPGEKWLGLYALEDYYVYFLDLDRNGVNLDGGGVLGMTLFPEDSPVYSPVVHRAEQLYIGAAERNLTRYGLHETFSNYAALAGLFAVLAVLLLTSPLVMTDRWRGIHLLLYASAKGRAVLRIQAAACLIAAGAMGLLTAVVSYGAFFALTDAGKYWSAHIGAFDRAVVLYDVAFRGYVLILGATTVSLCVGCAGLSFVLSRFSSGAVTLMLKAVPVALVLGFAAWNTLEMALTNQNMICHGVYTAGRNLHSIFLRGVEAPEVIFAGLLALVGLLAAGAVAAREKRADIV